MAGVQHTARDRLEGFSLRKIKTVNKHAKALGIRLGMDVTEAFSLIA